jgi:hypothetical protein
LNEARIMQIVYISYYSPVIHQRTIFSILSFITFHGLKYKILVFTDNPKYFEKLSPYIKIEKIKESDLEKSKTVKWINYEGVEEHYVWIIKPYILRNLKKSFVYLDSDTYVKKPMDDLIKKIDPFHCIMYSREYVLSCNVKYSLIEQSPLSDLFPPTLYMWNSGVIGIHHENIGIFNEVIELTKKLLATGVNIHIAEQLATCRLLLDKTTIYEAYEYVYHYWNEKEDHDKALEKYFAQAPFQVLLDAALKQGTNAKSKHSMPH